MNDGGKYEAQCTKVREDTQAKGAIVIVVNGNLGSGFSVQGEASTLAQLPTMLRVMADKIEQDMKVSNH